MDKNKSKYFVGIDGGGTKCKAIIVDIEGDILAQGLSGAANPFHNFEQTKENILLAIQSAMNEVPSLNLKFDQFIVGAGLAGVNVPSTYKLMQSWQHPFKEFYLSSDLHTATLGAHNGADGAVIVTGTGSCGFASVNGKQEMFGGYGFPWGDQASGAWFGLQAIELLFKVKDGLSHAPLLEEKLSQQLEIDSAIDIVERVANKAPNFFAAFAPSVFDCADQGEQACIDIVKEGIAYVEQMIERIESLGNINTALAGGLSHRLTTWLSSKTRSKLVTAQHSPEYGAVLLAHQQLLRSADL